MFGPNVPTKEELARRIRNPAVGEHGMNLLREFDVIPELSKIECPTLVCVGERDAVTPVAAAREILDALPKGLGRLEVIEGAGHFSWLDAPYRYWAAVESFLTQVGADRTAPH